ncbi:hypothetical protein OG203_10635 [Nocardia sp. NBC_01499]|uniref:hypothetical protein n=1 Tax=Nocardia sp. NBC_01499 TaxID=2903597 RepID=UPI00386CB2DF
MNNNEGNRIAGKTFSTPDEPPNPKLVAHALAIFAEYDPTACGVANRHTSG